LSKIDKEKLKNALASMREEELKNKFQLTQFFLVMLDWIKNINKELPEFWKTYLSKFDKNRIVMLLFQLKRQA
jgi:DNA primase large subunit